MIRWISLTVLSPNNHIVNEAVLGDQSLALIQPGAGFSTSMSMSVQRSCYASSLMPWRTCSSPSLVLYGIRLLAQATLKLSTNESRASTFLDQWEWRTLTCCRGQGPRQPIVVRHQQPDWCRQGWRRLRLNREQYGVSLVQILCSDWWLVPRSVP